MQGLAGGLGGVIKSVRLFEVDISIFLISIKGFMLRCITKPFQVVLLVCSVLNTGALILGLQLFAWFQMSKDLSQELPLLQAVERVASGEESCEICYFCNENNPLNDKGSDELVIFEPPLLYFPPLPAEFLHAMPERSLQSDPYSRILCSFELGIDPPPPKLG